ncbi:MAG: acyl-CoA/acyl-ACP dehydrogenase [Oscillochloris sp.]|nr:acyl-CoA/acyl-ACP dehydrogenase [Oscillochloris sp.]
MFSLSSRQQRFVAVADELAAQLAVHAAAHDAAGSFPQASYDLLRRAGYPRLIVPQEYGGEGADLLEMVLAQEYLARGDGATAMAVDMTVHLIGRLAETRQWPEPIFAQVCREIANEGALINAAASEPELGSPSRGGAPSTRAVRDGDLWRVNGHKQFVSMAPALRFFVVSVALPADEHMPEGGVANAIVRAGTAGVRYENTWGDALSLRSSGSYDLWLEDVVVPDAWVVDRKPLGAPAGKSNAAAAWFGLTLAAVYLGIGQAASDAVCAYANQRTPTALGKPIATLPNIQRRVGELQVQLDAARAHLYAVAGAYAADQSQRAELGPAVAAAKYLCTNAAVAATDQALRIAGGFGLTRRLPLERYFRDVRAGLTHPPSDDQALELVGRDALERAERRP